MGTPITVRRSGPLELVLASASPRRRQLLAQMGIPFRVSSVDLDETPGANESPSEYVLRLAQAKATAVYSRQPAGSCVLGADTTVVVDDQVLGKPRNRQHFLQMMAMLTGRSHQVLTGVAIQTDVVFTVVTESRVWFRPLTGEDIERYWQTGEPQDKAGGYGIQGKGGVFVERIQGSYSGIVGLPLLETSEGLKSVGFRLWMDSPDDAY